MLLGGGTRYGVPNDSLIELVSLPLLLLGLFRIAASPFQPEARAPILLIGCGTALVLLQIVPLPPILWTHLPGRAQFAETYGVAGMAVPWLSISLDPSATVRSALSLIPAIAIFLAVLGLPTGGRRALMVIVATLALVNVLWGLLQLMQGPDSPLYFFEFTARGSTVGLFGNRNHFSALLYSATPFIAAIGAHVVYRYGLRRPVPVAACVALYGALIVGLATATSRAGLLLEVIASLASLAMIWPRGVVSMQKRSTKLMVGAVIVVVAAAHLVLLAALGSRETLGDATRPQMALITLRAAWDFLPFGSGFGSFVPIFALYQEPATAFIRYVNHAHDDWAELILEGGVPAVLIMLAFLGWYLAALRRVWRRAGSRSATLAVLLPRAGSIVAGLLLLHSLADYPLRTITLAMVFALACGLLVPAPDSGEEEAPPGASSRHRGRRHGSRSRSYRA